MSRLEGRLAFQANRSSVTRWHNLWRSCRPISEQPYLDHNESCILTTIPGDLQNVTHRGYYLPQDSELPAYEFVRVFDPILRGFQAPW